MIYRVINGIKPPIPFNTFKEAKQFVNNNGGQIYVIEASCKYYNKYEN